MIFADACLAYSIADKSLFQVKVFKETGKKHIFVIIREDLEMTFHRPNEIVNLPPGMCHS